MVSNAGLPSGVAGKSLHMYSANPSQSLTVATPGGLIPMLSLISALVHNMSLGPNANLLPDLGRTPEEALCFENIFRDYVQSVEARNHMVRKLNASKHLRRIDPAYFKVVSDDEVESTIPEVNSFMNMVPINVSSGPSSSQHPPQESLDAPLENYDYSWQQNMVGNVEPTPTTSPTQPKSLPIEFHTVLQGTSSR